MTFQLSIKGGNEMNYRIEEKEAFRIVGIKRVPILFKGVNPDIASMWESLDEAAINQLKELSNAAPVGLISASTNFSEVGQRKTVSLITILAQPQRNIAQITYHSLESLPQRGLYSKQPDHFRMHCRKYGGGFIPNGFHRHIMNKLNTETLWNEHKDVTSPSFKSEIWIPISKRNISYNEIRGIKGFKEGVSSLPLLHRL